MAAATTETIQKLKFVLLPHPAHSPDLAPSDYPIFRLLKGADLLITKRSRMWYICGFVCKQKHSLHMALGSLMNKVTNVGRN
jgi:hypothetical protein